MMLAVKTRSTGTSLSVAALIMTGSVMLSRVMGLVREQVLAGFVGAHTEMDAYVAAFLVPELLNHLMAGGFLSITFIPIFQRYFSKGEEDNAWRCFSNILTITGIALVVVVGLCMIFTADFLSWAQGLKGNEFSSRDQEWIALTVRLTRIVLPAQLFFYIGSFLMAAQYATKRFLMPALSPLIYNIGIILGGVVLGPWLGVEGFAWGVLAGAFVGSIVLQVSAAAKIGIRYTPRFDVADPDLRSYVLLTLPFIWGVGMTFSNEFMFRFFGLSLGKGGIAHLNYALRTMMLLVGVFGQALAAASYPFLSQLAVEKRLGEMHQLSQTLLRRTATLLIPLMASMVALGTPVIAVLFQRGRFDAHATEASGALLSVYALGAFGFSAAMIVMRNFYALQSTLFPMIVSTILVIAFFPLHWVLSSWRGATGIAVAGALYMNAQFVVFLLFWARRSRSRVAPLGFFILKVGFASSLGGLVAWFAARGLDWIHFPPVRGIQIDDAAILMIGGTLSLAVSFGVMKLLRISEVADVLRLVTRAIAGKLLRTGKTKASSNHAASTDLT